MDERSGLRWMRLMRFPPAARTMPVETRAVLRFCVGKTFRVTETSQNGWVGLDVSPDVDRRFGGISNEIWVEAEHLQRDVPRLNAAPGGPAFGEVTHLAYGSSAVGRLKTLGARRVLGTTDDLTTGPAALVPRKHLELRKAYWRAFYRRLPRPTGGKARQPPRFSAFPGEVNSSAELKEGLRGRRTGQPIVLWCGASWDEVIFSWWACDACFVLESRRETSGSSARARRSRRGGDG